MKVLEEGTSLKNWTVKVQCKGNFAVGGCNALLEANMNDIRRDYYNRNDEEFFVICPICKQQITIPHNKIPAVIRDHIRDRRPIEKEHEM